MTDDFARHAQRRHVMYAWMLLSPALVLLTLFAFIPAVNTLWASLFSRGTARREPVFVGLDNYATMLADPTFWQVAQNNLLYAAVTIPLSIVLALAMALWANAKITGRAWVRVAYFTPAMLPMIAAANLWLFFYTPGLGVLDRITALFGISSTNWLGQPETALWAVMAVTIWKEAGFFMIFYLAALQTIPPDLQEAARIEGASRWQTLRRVVLPLLMPTTIFVAVNALINAVKLIDHLFVLTKGGPNNASKLLLYWVWENAFAYLDRPSAAVLTVILLTLLGVLAALQFFVLERRTHYR
ncbi:sugar ABC transporter permease [Achromobacter sp. GG226]|uniref:carbohydrate ABC transporter permease n=1 Tax=Verticiella alkaliphila TaxID=2779529 RepID=UPI001C0DDCFC|nr:sugar ABC transporter permease [Verticiella sp. GG226]MBU4611929.1 sugar ABC transporter permease [Verticiella sp. GG226]